MTSNVGGAKARAVGFSISRCSWPDHVFRFFADHWKAVLFSAAISTLLERFGLLRVLTKFSVLVVSSIASQGSSPPPPLSLSAGLPTVILLSNGDFISRYGERSPLDRCVMAGDLRRILAKSPRILAIDFDLSPLAAASPSEARCQQELDGLLDQYSDRLLALLPFPAATAGLLQTKHAWMQARCNRGLHFADGAIEQSLGLVTELTVGTGHAFALRVADQLHAQEMSGAVCEHLQGAVSAQENHWLIEPPVAEVHGDEGHETVEVESLPINFSALASHLVLLPLGSPEFAALPSLKQSVVLFGGDWGHDDNFLTSIGSLPGVVVHAARLISLTDPIQPLPPLVSLLSDIGIALCFAWLIEKFWAGYVHARRLDMAFKHAGRTTALSTWLMAGFVMTYLSLVLFFFLAAEHLFSSWGVVIAPLLIAMSMLVDGFVSGPVEQIQILLKEEPRATRHGTPHLRAPMGAETRRLLVQAIAALALPALVAFAVFVLPKVAPNLALELNGVAPKLAAGLFVTALVLLYGLMPLLHVLKLCRSGWAHWHHFTEGRLSVFLNFRRSGRVLWHRFAAGLCAFLALRLSPAVKRMEKHWRHLSCVGQFLALIRTLVFWAVLLAAGSVLSGYALHI